MTDRIDTPESVPDGRQPFAAGAEAAERCRGPGHLPPPSFERTS